MRSDRLRALLAAPRPRVTGAALSAVLVACLAGTAPVSNDVRLVRAGSYESGEDRGAEILSVQARTRRMVVTNSAFGTVEVIDIAHPESLHRIGRFALGLEEGEVLTSVAFHPIHDYFLAAVQAADPFAPGRVEIRSATTGKRGSSLAAGVGPDCVEIDPTGRFALAACEGESFVEGPDGVRSPPGSLTLVRLDRDPAACTAVQIDLPPDLDVPGATRPEDGRSIERSLRKPRGEDEEVLVPLADTGPELAEPECATFSPDGRWGFVTVQEQNVVLRVDTQSARIDRVFGLGTTEHAADVEDDGKLDFAGRLRALREPDGIAVTPDGRYFVTADEGDTEPKVSQLAGDRPAGGGRTVSVFDAQTGAFVGDTGDLLDRAAAGAGLYPDERSDRKGSEPEMLTLFEMAGRTYAAVGLERADAVALVDLSIPAHPRVVAIAGVGANSGPQAPEGIAHYEDPETGRHYVFSANEESGTVATLSVSPVF